MSPTRSTDDFSGLGLAPKLLATLDRLRFTTPTPIQLQAIPVAISGKDLIGIAQTGTGKTLAFGLPMLQRLAQVKGRGLIILPTRELAIQVDEMLHQIGRPLGLRTAVLIGGQSAKSQEQALRRQPHIIVVTPGRLLDHLEQGTVRLNDISILVLDEADRMLDMGFAPQLNRILAKVPKQRQTMLFSATMPEDIVRIATKHMHLPLRVEVAPPGTAAAKVTHEVFVVEKSQKTSLLTKLLGEYRGSVLAFTRTKHGAKKVTQALKHAGYNVAELHSNRSLGQRRDALEGFKTGKYRVLVATDIAARGIDVTGIELVVNVDLPATPDDYIHRIGRTARAGRAGHAISFATPDQGRDLRAIERLLQKRLPVSRLPDLPPAPKFEPRPFVGPSARPYGRPAHRRQRRPSNRYRRRWN
ncbi:MAG: DEAD/DEAH box helicase [Candidatus Kerfeldbacteria bacterium]|nr:DEAD/DEAH box helicase [Candidatus Kerfeldbacteria bacterium]